MSNRTPSRKLFTVPLPLLSKAKVILDVRAVKVVGTLSLVKVNECPDVATVTLKELSAAVVKMKRLPLAGTMVVPFAKVKVLTGLVVPLVEKPFKVVVPVTVTVPAVEITQLVVGNVRSVKVRVP